MACDSNNFLRRFLVRAKREEGIFRHPYVSGFINLPHTDGVDGLTVGKTGRYEIVEPGRKVSLNNFVETLDDIKITHVFPKDKLGTGRTLSAFYEELNSNKKNCVMTLFIAITDKKFCPFYVYRAYGCTFAGCTEPAASKSTPSLFTLTATYVPYDVERLDSVMNITDPAIIGSTFAAKL